MVDMGGVVPAGRQPRARVEAEALLQFHHGLDHRAKIHALGTEEVLAQLGYSSVEIGSLREAKVI